MIPTSVSLPEDPKLRASDTAASWLKNAGANNIIVFDYYHILTGEGASDLPAFATARGCDSHPSQAGNTRAAEAFVPFLNRAVARAGLSQ